MRWFWIDRYTEFESGQHATAIKNVSLAEEHLHDHFPGYPMMPNPLVVEGMAQTGGLLVGRTQRLRRARRAGQAGQGRVPLLGRPRRHAHLSHARSKTSDKDGAMVSGTSHVGQRLQAEVQMVFAHLPDDRAGKVAVRSGRVSGDAEAVGSVRNRSRCRRQSAASARNICSMPRLEDAAT